MPDLVTALSDPNYVMHQTTPDMGAKSLSCETELVEPAVMRIKKRAPSFMDHVLAARTVTKTTEDVIRTVVESDSDATEHESQPL